MKILILDEADELLTPQFKVQIEKVLEDVPQDKQMMLFSATMPPNIKNLTKRSVVQLEHSNSLLIQVVVVVVVFVFFFGARTNRFILLNTCILIERILR